MHITQFTKGDVIRHSGYTRGVGYAIVDKVTETKVTIRVKGGSKPTVVAEGDPKWDDGEWAIVTPQWFISHGKRVPKAIQGALTPPVIAPNKGNIGSKAT